MEKMDSCCYPWLSVILTGIVTWLVYSSVIYLKETFKLNSVIKRKQREREESFKALEAQSEYQLNSENEKILSLSEEELIDSLQNRKLKATQVLNAFIAKALKVTREFNCITEFIHAAHEWAEELDRMEKVKGPFHGLPISIKDNCHVKGMDSTIGLGKFLYQPMEESSILVQTFMDLGAIPFCKTNVPQTLLSINCHNPIFGQTKNCLNPKLSPGGSSGGESCLIGAGGSILGVGSDIGGSVRIPAAFTGISGIKGTMHRLSSIGFRGSLPNVVGVIAVPGLMAKNAKLLMKAFKTLVNSESQNKLDPLSLPIPWNEKMFSSKTPMRIGYFTSLPYFPLVGDTENVILKAKEALEKEGHTLVPFELPDSFDMMNLVFDFTFADKGVYLLRNWAHEPIPLTLIFNYIICKAPLWFRSIIAAVMEFRLTPVIHSTRASAIIRGGADHTVKLWERLADRKALVLDIMKKWRSQNLDLLLCPCYPFPAIPAEYCGRLQPSVVYTMIFNLIDFPGGVVKFGKESGQNIEEYDDEGDMVLRLAKKASRESIGMPISVQLIGLPYTEEKVLRGLVELENIHERTQDK